METTTMEDLQEGSRSLSDSLRSSMRRAQEGLTEMQHLLAEKSKAAAQATDRCVHDHPWQAMGVALAAGLLLGSLFMRK